MEPSGFQITRNKADRCAGLSSCVGEDGNPDIISDDPSPRELVSDALDYPEDESIDAPGLDAMRRLFESLSCDIRLKEPDAKALAITRRILSLGVGLGCLNVTLDDAGRSVGVSRQAVLQMAEKMTARIGLHRQRKRSRRKRESNA